MSWLIFAGVIALVWCFARFASDVGDAVWDRWLKRHVAPKEQGNGYTKANPLDAFVDGTFTMGDQQFHSEVTVSKAVAVETKLVCEAYPAMMPQRAIDVATRRIQERAK